MLRRVLLAAAVSIGGGCYSPSIDACQLACASNNACPDGLACNAQGVCATSATDTCENLDAGDDDPRAVDVLVLDEVGNAAADARVVFVDAEGTEVAEIMTGTDGRASAVIGENGTVTVIRTVDTGNAKFLAATTFVAPPEGARLVSQHAPRTVTTTRTVTFPPMGPNEPTLVASSCGREPVELAPGVATARIEVFDRCASADYAIASRPSNGAEFPPYLLVAPDRSGTEISVGGAWATMQPFTLHYQPVPSDVSGAAVGAGISVFLAMDAPPVRDIAGGVVGTTMGAVEMYAPVQAPFASTLRLQYANPAGTSYQEVHQRQAPGTSAYNTSLVGTLVPYPVMPSVDLAGRQLSWMELAPGVNPAGEIDGALISLIYRRGTTPLSWRFVVPADKLPLQGDTRTLVFPDLPGDRVFEPVTGDVLIAGEIKTFNVPSPAVRPVMSSLEVLDNNDRMFTAPGVEGYVITRLQVKVP